MVEEKKCKTVAMYSSTEKVFWDLGSIIFYASMTFVCLTKSVAQIVLLQDPDYVLIIITMNCFKTSHMQNY